MSRWRLPVPAGLAVALTALLTGVEPASGQVAVRAQAERADGARGWIGINLEATESHGPDGRIDSRLVIQSVVEGSPADRARLQPGDIILRVNDRPAHLEAFARLASRLRPGDRFRLTLTRDGARWEGWERRVTVEAGERPGSEMVALPAALVGRLDSTIQRLDSVVIRITRTESRFRGTTVILGQASAPSSLVGTARMTAVGADSTPTFMFYPARSEGLVWASSDPAPPRAERPQTEAERMGGTLEETLTVRPLMPYIAGQNRVAGAELTPMNPGLATYFAGARGLLVTAVIDGTPAREAGLEPGDVVIGAGGARVASLAELRSALAGGGQTLDVIRRGNTLRVTLPR